MPQESVTRIIASAWSQPARLSELEKRRRQLVANFTDIKGLTAYFERHGDAAGITTVHPCHEILRPVVEEHGGQLFPVEPV